MILNLLLSYLVVVEIAFLWVATLELVRPSDDFAPFTRFGHGRQ